MKRELIFALLACVAVVGCASSPPPPPGQPVAADNGQPKMQAALAYLNQARASVEAASPNKGGHREAALQLIGQAIGATQAGMQWAAAHPHEVGPMEGPAAPEPVNGNVPGAERQPRMHEGVIALREARRLLIESEADKGGYRAQAINLVNQALVQLREGITFANTH